MGVMAVQGDIVHHLVNDDNQRRFLAGLAALNISDNGGNSEI